MLVVPAGSCRWPGIGKESVPRSMFTRAASARLASIESTGSPVFREVLKRWRVLEEGFRGVLDGWRERLVDELYFLLVVSSAVLHFEDAAPPGGSNPRGPGDGVCSRVLEVLLKIAGTSGVPDVRCAPGPGDGPCNLHSALFQLMLCDTGAPRLAGFGDVVRRCVSLLEGAFDEMGDSFLDDDWISWLYQDLLDASDRHGAGEHYTPPWLCDLMTRELLAIAGDGAPDAKSLVTAAKTGDRSGGNGGGIAGGMAGGRSGGDAPAVAHHPPPGFTILDPTCGTGAFLRSIVRVITRAVARGRRKPSNPLEPSEPPGSPEPREPTDAVASWSRVFDIVNGLDVNPVAVIAARVNAWLAIGDPGLDISRMINMAVVGDVFTAFKDGDCFDAVVGNPPWVTLKDFPGTRMKSRVLQVSRELGIAPSAHDVPQLELGVVIARFCLDRLLRPGGSLFLVLTSSVLNGKHCGTFRRLDGVVGGEAWTFSGAKVFPKEFTCLLLRKAPARQTGHGPRLPPGPCPGAGLDRITPFGPGGAGLRHVHHEIVFDVANGRPARIEPIGQAKMLVPYNIGGVVYGDEPAGRYVPASKLNSILPRVPGAHYKKKCYNGATVFPQNLLFVTVKPASDEPGLVEIRPDPTLNSKKPWDFIPYDSAIVESHYCYDLVKGSELVPFLLLSPRKVFLPVRVDPAGGQLVPVPCIFEENAPRPPGDGPGGGGTGQEKQVAGGGTPPVDRGCTHFKMLDAMFRRVYKGSTRIKNLWDRINFDGALTNPSMRKPYKVVFPDCGSTMAAAVADADVIVEHALHYVGLDSVDEAHYLCGVLNAPVIQQDLELKKAERHIGQLAMEYPIPQFDPSNPLHAELSRIARDASARVKEIVQEHVESKRRASIGKFQCIASKSILREKDIPKHLARCKKLVRLAENGQKGSVRPDPASLFTKITGKNVHEVEIPITKKKVATLIDADTRMQELLHRLDESTRELLGANA